MIRLAVIGADKAFCAALAARLRDVTLDDAPLQQSLEACQGAVFFDPPFDEVERCLQADKPVLIATASGLTREMLNALSAKVNLTIVNPDRYLPSRQLIRQQLDAGTLGTPGLIRIHRWTPPLSEAVGLLYDLDLLLWFFGALPNVAFAVAHARGTQIHLGFPAGGMALLDHANLPVGDAYCSLSVIGAHGAAYADDHQNMQLAYRGGASQSIRSDEGVRQWVTLLQEFIDHIAGHDSNRVMNPTGSAWRQVLTLAEAVEASLRTKQAVALKGAP